MSEKLKQFLIKYDLECYLDVLKENDVKLRDIKEFKDNDINELIKELLKDVSAIKKISHNRRLRKAINALKNNQYRREVNVDKNELNQNDGNKSGMNNITNIQVNNNDTNRNDINNSYVTPDIESIYNSDNDLHGSEYDSSDNEDDIIIQEKELERYLDVLKSKISVKNDKPYQCKYCDYKSAYKYHLQSHERIHFSIKPFKCKYCNFTTKHKSSIYRHEQQYCKKRNQ